MSWGPASGIAPDTYVLIYCRSHPAWCIPPTRSPMPRHESSNRCGSWSSGSWGGSRMNPRAPPRPQPHQRLQGQLEKFGDAKVTEIWSRSSTSWCPSRRRPGFASTT